MPNIVSLYTQVQKTVTKIEKGGGEREERQRHRQEREPKYCRPRTKTSLDEGKGAFNGLKVR